MALQDDDEPGGVPEWVVTFGDMMSLLLTFFIMLVSLSEVKEQEKYQAIVESMRRQFGHDLSTNSLVPGWTKPRNAVLANLATMGRAKKYDIMKGGSKEAGPTGDDARVRIIRQGDRTAIGTVVFFQEDSAELGPRFRQDLQRLAMELTGKPQIVEIRGHTSLRPAEDFTTYEDNWVLAFARAKSTMRFLVDELGIDERRIRLSMAGPNEPLHIGTDPEQLRQNARVEVYLTDEVVSERVGTEEERKQLITDELGG